MFDGSGCPVAEFRPIVCFDDFWDAEFEEGLVSKTLPYSLGVFTSVGGESEPSREGVYTDTKEGVAALRLGEVYDQIRVDKLHWAGRKLIALWRDAQPSCRISFPFKAMAAVSTVPEDVRGHAIPVVLCHDAREGSFVTRMT